MGALKKLVIAILAFSFLVFCALFGQLPRLRFEILGSFYRTIADHGIAKTPVGMINRLIWIRIPSALLTIDKYITGGRSAGALKRTGHYLMKENHPVVLIFYLLIMVIAQLMYLPPVLAVLPWSFAWPVYPLVVMPYVFTWLTTTSTSSFVSPQSVGTQMRDYPYDRILYRPGLECITCGTLKPARSKHCRICGRCVHRMDHHCIWVRNCLGRDNYVWFLAMLLALALMLAYGAYLGWRLLDATIQDMTDAQRTTTAGSAGKVLASSVDLLRGPRWTKGLTWSRWLDRWTWAFATHLRVSTVALLAAMTAPLAGGLLVYHVYLLSGGMTTNESFKWEEWAEDVQDGFVFACSDPLHTPRPDPTQIEPDPDYGAKVSQLSLQHTEPRATNWPIAPRQRIVSRANRPSLDAELTPGSILGAEPWIGVDDFKTLINIYNLGFWGNLRDALNLS